MTEKMTEMYELQNKLNISTNGANWLSGVARNGKSINWFRCITFESAELCNSISWKHWKDVWQDDDIANIRIEIVDIWHFMVSQHLVNLKGDIKKAVADVLQEYNNASDKLYVSHHKDMSILELGEKMMLQSLLRHLDFKLFFLLVAKVENFSMDDVYSLYIGKNCLNEFRQKNGYADGIYKKLWAGEEDNVHMQRLLESNPNMTFDELYRKLDTIYKSLV